MGKDLYDSNLLARELFENANNILGYNITDVMFYGSAADLVATKITQPAVFLHSVISAKCMTSFEPDMVAGHSLGEFSALAAVGAIKFEDALVLVYKRAMAMQKACDDVPGTMAAILGLEDNVVEQICSNIEGVVIPANYNCPGQLVISGERESVQKACDSAKEAGAKRAMLLNVGGAFHSPLMESARAELAEAIEETKFSKPICPIYQNVDGIAHMDPQEIKENLLAQLSSPVLWTASVKNMLVNGATEFIEVGPGKVLSGLVKKISV